MPPDSTSLTMTFPEHLSYVLGCKDKTQLTIGPISHGDDRENTGANGVSFAHNITISGQSPPSTIRTIPRILYVCTDIISAVSRNLWLRDTPYESCHIIYTHVIDDSNITTKFVCKTSDTLTFHRISSLQCLWNSFKFVRMSFRNPLECLLICEAFLEIFFRFVRESFKFLRDFFNM